MKHSQFSVHVNFSFSNLKWTCSSRLVSITNTNVLAHPIERRNRSLVYYMKWSTGGILHPKLSIVYVCLFVTGMSNSVYRLALNQGLKSIRF